MGYKPSRVDNDDYSGAAHGVNHRTAWSRVECVTRNARFFPTLASGARQWLEQDALDARVAVEVVCIACIVSVACNAIFFPTLARGARQLVMQNAIETRVVSRLLSMHSVQYNIGGAGCVGDEGGI